jgi:PAS domain S-box-containing protein
MEFRLKEDPVARKRTLRLSASSRAVIMLTGTVVLSTAIAVAALIVDLRTRELNHANREIVSVSKMLAEQTARTLDGVELAMEGVRERLSNDIGRSLDLSHPAVQLLLTSRSNGLPQIKSMFVADHEGINVNSSRPDFVRRLSLSDREFFRHFVDRNSEEIFVSRPEKARVDDQLTFYISMRLNEPDGSFRGVVVSAISIGRLEALYESVELNFVNRIQLLHRDGVLMAGTVDRRALLGTGVVDQALPADDAAATGSVVIHDEAAEGRWHTAYRDVSSYPLRIATSVNEAVALRNWQGVARTIGGGTAVIILLTLTTAALMLKGILRRERLEEELKISDRQLRLTVQTVRDPIVTLNPEGRIILFNRAAEHFFATRFVDALGQDAGSFFTQSQPPAVATRLLQLLATARQTQDEPQVELITLSHQGNELPFELSLSTASFLGETLVTAVFHDLSERRRAELELMQKNRQLQELSAAIQNVRERERSRISRELHDELGQSLTGMRLEVSWLGSRLKTAHPELARKVTTIKELIDQTIGAVRRISAELRPLVLDDLGFAAAATWYTDQFAARTGLVITLELPAIDPPKGGAVATALFRILQESLTNIARHAAARTVDVRLRFADSQWQLSIRDDGQGFAIADSPRGGIGLIGMEERAQILGGRLSIATRPGQGTRIDVRIPDTATEEESHEANQGTAG